MNDDIDFSDNPARVLRALAERAGHELSREGAENLAKMEAYLDEPVGADPEAGARPMITSFEDAARLAQTVTLVRACLSKESFPDAPNRDEEFALDVAGLKPGRYRVIDDPVDVGHGWDVLLRPALSDAALAWTADAT